MSNFQTITVDMEVLVRLVENATATNNNLDAANNSSGYDWMAAVGKTYFFCVFHLFSFESNEKKNEIIHIQN